MYCAASSSLCSQYFCEYCNFFTVKEAVMLLTRMSCVHERSLHKCNGVGKLLFVGLMGSC